MHLMLRTVRDKYGDRRHIIFRESDGLQKPLAILTVEDWDQLVKMHDEEQAALDEALNKELS